MNEKQARHAVDKALREDDPVVFADALMEVVDCSDDDRYARLPPLLKAAVAVNAFSLEMTSGGVQQLIANMAPSLLADVEEGLDLIGAREAQKLVSDVRSRFPNGAVPGDEEARSRQLDGIAAQGGGRALRALDKAYEATGEDVLELLKAFVARQRDDVVDELVSSAQASR